MEYPNHYQMKKARLEKLKQTKCKCEICGSKANVVHHIDETKYNHQLDNLISVCNSCHQVLHHKGSTKRQRKTSKYIRLYGFTLSELSDSIGINPATLCRMHKKRTLGHFLQKKKIKDKQLVKTA